MRNIGYYNGKVGPLEEMTVPMNDRALYFGDGVYDATYSRNHIVWQLEEHVARLYRSADKLGIGIPHTPEELCALISRLVTQVDDGDQFVYFQVTRGTAYRAHVYGEMCHGNVWVMLRPMKVKDVYKKIKLITEPDTRFLHCDIKTLNLIPSVMAAQKAELAGANEAVLHRDGRVTECAHSNVHILKDGVFRTAPTDNLILPGIARANLIRYCGILGIPVREEAFTVEEMMEADEIMTSSVSCFCLAAEEIDGKPVGGKAPALLRSLQDMALKEFTEATDA
jgi:D-alanine transaminase